MERLIGNIEAFIYRHTGDAMKGWRTMAIGLGFAALGVALVLLSEEHADAGFALIASGASMAGLRTVTTTPMGAKE